MLRSGGISLNKSTFWQASFFTLDNVYRLISAAADVTCTVAAAAAAAVAAVVISFLLHTVITMQVSITTWTNIVDYNCTSVIITKSSATAEIARDADDVDFVMVSGSLDYLIIQLTPC